LNESEVEALQARIDALRAEHGDLDDAIARLVGSPSVDEIRLKRMKKRKLALKDMITRTESALIPDLNA